MNRKLKKFLAFHQEPQNELKDLQGNPYKFYRGGNCSNISSGCFFCSCFDIAKSHTLSEKGSVIETEIAVKNPLVIDATTKQGYSDFNHLNICNCKLYPEEIREDLVQYSKKNGYQGELSTDQVVKLARGIKEIDGVIIKNVREGNNNKFPIYDVIVWNKKNLVNTKNVKRKKYKFEEFRKDTFKRVDLSMYIPEKEKDGVIHCWKEDGYFIEDIIYRDNTDWNIKHELVIYADNPIEIYCLDSHKYVTADQLDPGIYINTEYLTSGKKFIPYNGMVRVKGFGEVKNRFRIEE